MNAGLFVNNLTHKKVPNWFLEYLMEIIFDQYLFNYHTGYAASSSERYLGISCSPNIGND